MKKKTAILLVNLGTPDSPKVKDVRHYLTEFLNDPRVIDISPLARFFLVNGIIVPFRSRSSSKLYKMLWTEKGSPLLYHSEALKMKLEAQFKENEETDIFLAMRYQNPSIPDTLKAIKKGNYQRMIVFPLFPQYASATVGTATVKIANELAKWWIIPELKVIGPYFDHPDFIAAWKEQASNYNVQDYDHILFSYHGLPIRQLDKNHDDGNDCKYHKCREEINKDNYYCYLAECYGTTRKIAEALNISKEDYTVTFQSKLGKTPWVEPATDKVLKEKAKKGTKKILVFSPAFTADCIETTIEIGYEYKELFEEHGGEQLDLVESLNDNPRWVEAVYNILGTYL